MKFSRLLDATPVANQASASPTTAKEELIDQLNMMLGVAVRDALGAQFS